QLRSEPRLEPWQACWDRAEAELVEAGTFRDWPARERHRLLARRARRHLIDRLLLEAAEASVARAQAAGVTTFEAAIHHREPLVTLPAAVGQKVRARVDFLFQHASQPPLVVRQNGKDRWSRTRLFDRLLANRGPIPRPHY